MTILNIINHSQSLVQQISSINKDGDVKRLLSSLSTELASLESSIKQLQSGTETATNKPEIKSGCYLFSGEKGFFCPNCYDNAGNKVPTKRLNSQLRVCPVCRASIK